MKSISVRTATSKAMRRRRRRHLLAAAMFGGAMIAGGIPAASAGDGHGVVYKSLDTVAGGIEKLFGLGESSAGTCDDGCDDSCDHPTMEHMHTSPHDSPIYLKPNPHFDSHAPVPPPSMVPLQSVPMKSESIESLPANRQKPMTKVKPRLNSQPGDYRRDLPPPIIRQPIGLPGTQRDQSSPRQMIQAPKVNDSYFEKFDDPFKDDSASIGPIRRINPFETPVKVEDQFRFNPIRKVGFEELKALAPVSRHQR